MHDLIQKVMAAEVEAKKMVQAARAEAERIVADAQSRAQEQTTAARQQIELETRQILEAASEHARREKLARIAAVTAEIEKQIRLDEPARRQAVDAVLRCVCG